ncbi:unnamed protein product [Spirodela intermedia]|uniref:Uncharacterized protein n=1 Tax=Spirodela intermedia TaxID=51605 RepID=A0A7I8JRL1_SPIIN|nr:unnamed protein product [Spirodela intermedia]CAA6672847.1 unnamed protein product [Spirodela intermedia]
MLIYVDNILIISPGSISISKIISSLKTIFTLRDLFKRLLRYLKGTITEGLQFNQQSDLIISLSCDVDWAGSFNDRRSTSGFLLYLGSNLISWSTKKQSIVARSSTKSKYKAIANGTSELKWLQSLLREISISICTTPILWCDNIRATYLAANLVFHAKMKHIEIDFHFFESMSTPTK